MITPRQLIVTYLIAQAIGTAAWWVGLLTIPGLIDWFKPAAWPDDSLLGFWLGDSVLLVLGSVLTAVAVSRQAKLAATAIWALAAATWYPTLYCIAVSLMTNEAWVATAMMCAMAGMTLSLATVHGQMGQTPASFRAVKMPPRVALAWTLIQTIVFWAVLLWFVPKGIDEFATRLGFEHFSHPAQIASASAVFAAASMLGLWSGWTMSTLGRGTPLPTATASQLVIQGPYRYVRNPMALAGIIQGLAVGWGMGSPIVILYALIGAATWHAAVRPREESDLHDRFGEAYESYQSRVQLWVPRFRAPLPSKPGASDDGTD